jgi:hypothetical protein
MLVGLCAAAIGASASGAAATTRPPSCTSAQLRLEQYGSPSGLVANSAGLFRFTNRSDVSCRIEGYPSFRAYGLSGKTALQRVGDGGDYIYPNPPQRVVTLEPGTSAYFAVGWTRGGPATDCLGSPTATRTELVAKSTPPGQQDVLVTSFTTFQNYCGPIAVSDVGPLTAFRPGSSG